MSKQLFIRFIGYDSWLTNPKLYINNEKYGDLYDGDLISVELTEPATTFYVCVYAYKSATVTVKQNDEIEYLEVEYFAERYIDTSIHDRDVFRNDEERTVYWLQQILDAIYFYTFVVPGIKEAFKEGMVRIRCYKKKSIQQ